MIEIEPLFKDYVDFDTFSTSDFRVVEILDFTLNDGFKERIILSGIHAFYEPADLIGKKAVAILNLPPRNMMGIDSCGMLISMVCNVDNKEHLKLLIVDDDAIVGSKLY